MKCTDVSLPSPGVKMKVPLVSPPCSPSLEGLSAGNFLLIELTLKSCCRNQEDFVSNKQPCTGFPPHWAFAGSGHRKGLWPLKESQGRGTPGFQHSPMATQEWAKDLIMIWAVPSKTHQATEKTLIQPPVWSCRAFSTPSTWAGRIEESIKPSMSNSVIFTAFPLTPKIRHELLVKPSPGITGIRGVDLLSGDGSWARCRWVQPLPPLHCCLVGSPCTRQFQQGPVGVTIGNSSGDVNRMALQRHPRACRWHRGSLFQLSHQADIPQSFPRIKQCCQELPQEAQQRGEAGGVQHSKEIPRPFQPLLENLERLGCEIKPTNPGASCLWREKK